MALRKNAKIELLRRMPLFAQFSGRELAEVATMADELDVRQGKELTRQGRPGREFFVLVEGQADVIRDGRRVFTLGRGDFFGEISLIAKRPRTATVVATTPARVLVVTDRSFQQLLERFPSIQTKVLQALAERVGRDLL
jgi:CRP/FNR family cyclic AMP-dependent transcriptional regulator